MTNQDTYRIPARIIRKIGTRNPFVLAKELGVHVMMRNDFDRQKGAFAMVLNVPFIFINANLLMIKMIEMQRRNDIQVDLPCIPGRDFLGKISDDAGSL